MFSYESHLIRFRDVCTQNYNYRNCAILTTPTALPRYLDINNPVVFIYTGHCLFIWMPNVEITFVPFREVAIYVLIYLALHAHNSTHVHQRRLMP